VDTELSTLAADVGARLKRSAQWLATAESCTGGGLTEALTAIPGSSAWFERGFITYSNLAKQELLGVPEEMIAQHGAVSAVVARAMAEGVLAHSHAQFAIAITGIAGPGGGSAEKPVGTVIIAWAGTQRESREQQYAFVGDRAMIRRQSVLAALQGLLRYIGE